MLQILDTLVLVLFVLFLVYIFRGYHLSRRERDLDNHSDSASSEKPNLADRDDSGESSN